MSIEFMDLADAALQIGMDELSKQLVDMSMQTYDFWWDLCFKDHLDEYPSWKTLYNRYMELAVGRQQHGYLIGLAAVCNNRLVGYASVRINEFPAAELQGLKHPPRTGHDNIWIADLFIWPEWRYNGAASGLFRFAREWILANEKIGPEIAAGRESIYLACEDHLIRFYEKLGCELLSTWAIKGWHYLRVMPPTLEN